MSSIAASVFDAISVYAQVSDPTPERPPLADKIDKFLRYGTWLAILSGTISIIFAGAKFAWEKWSGSGMESPKMVAGAMIGGVVATSAGTIMNTVLSI